MKRAEESSTLTLSPRESTEVTIKVPRDTLDALGKVAASRDTSIEALLRFYVGQGLRQDTAKHFSDHVLETTAQVLSRHIRSEEERLTILHEIQIETASA